MPPIRTSHAETRIYRQDYALYIEFDYNDRVRRFQPMMIPKNGLSVMEWLDRE
jgi:hypothetical protein